MRVGGNYMRILNPGANWSETPRAVTRVHGGSVGSYTVTPATNPAEPLLKYRVTATIVYALQIEV